MLIPPTQLFDADDIGVPPQTLQAGESIKYIYAALYDQQKPKPSTVEKQILKDEEIKITFLVVKKDTAEVRCNAVLLSISL